MRISDWSSDVCSSDLCRGSLCLESGSGRGRPFVAPPACRSRHSRRGSVSGLNSEGSRRRKKRADRHLRHQAEPTGDRLWLYRGRRRRSEEHTSELQLLMRISYAVFCLNKKKRKKKRQSYNRT